MALPARHTSVSSHPLERWEPFHELEHLREHMDWLMHGLWSPLAPGDGGPWMPVADIEETEDAWIIAAELPGVDKEDVNVELLDRELVISGEIKEGEHEGVVRKRMRRTGRFEYRVTLPGQADPEQIDASLHDGVLTIRVPKSETAKARQIEVLAR